MIKEYQSVFFEIRNPKQCNRVITVRLQGVIKGNLNLKHLYREIVFDTKDKNVI